MAASHHRRYHRVKAIVQSSIGHTGIEPKAFFNAIGQTRSSGNVRFMSAFHPIATK
jgi:hypothetical protein